MNYIRHLNAFFSRIKSDGRLTASHVSLYMALFHYWNFNRFQNPFSIYRENIMQLSKIGSKNTYHKCMKELHEAKYIYYHPAPFKFQVVRISVIRLDTEPEIKSPYTQLHLFPDSPSPGAGPGTDIDTGSVPKSVPASTDFDTVPVSNLGHLNKPNNDKQRETLAHDFLKRGKNDIEIKDTAGVPKLGHADILPSSDQGTQIPIITEIETFFRENNYTNSEAKKFYSHYKALGWKIQGKTPIQDWRSLVVKWMENAKRWVDQSNPISQKNETSQQQTIQHLYDSYLDGKKVFKDIRPEHFDQLNLQLSEEIMQQAWQERIYQVSGTNQHTLSQLWQAYLVGNPEDQLIQKDKPQLIALAKRIAVVKHFQELKQSPLKNK